MRFSCRPIQLFMKHKTELLSTHSSTDWLKHAYKSSWKHEQNNFDKYIQLSRGKPIYGCPAWKVKESTVIWHMIRSANIVITFATLVVVSLSSLFMNSVSYILFYFFLNCGFIVLGKKKVLSLLHQNNRLFSVSECFSVCKVKK